MPSATTLTRRSLCWAIASLSLWRGAQAAGLPTLGVIEEVADALGKAADAISKLADSVAHIAELGAKGFDEVVARRARSELLELRAITTNITASQSTLVFPAIESYLRASSMGPDTRKQKWQTVIDELTRILTKATDILKRIKAVRSDFILEGAYEDLLVAMEARVSLVDKLARIAPPESPEELEALRVALGKYHELHTATRKASGQLAEYLKETKR